jgi:glucose/arabinose dehydrogenase
MASLPRSFARLVGCASLLLAANATALDTIELVPLVTSLNAVPIVIANAGDDSGRLFIATQDGRILIWDGTQLLPTPFLDISSLVNQSGGEQGLLGLVFHPDYANNGYFYVNYTNKPAGDTVIVRYQVSDADPDLANPASITFVLFVDQPQANHNGGQLLFGPDGYLYIGFGDGGGGGDPGENAENLGVLLGKILRVDVDAGGSPPYAIPPSNPFVATPGARGEIWAYGMRNPWRFFFDRLTGDLWIGDVGQSKRDEIDFEPAGSSGGRNYGWDRMEGSLCYEPATNCNDGTLTLPVLEIDITGPECAVIGGPVYRGVRNPDLYGRTLYGDACSGRFWTALPAGGGTFTSEEAVLSSVRPTSFGEDEAGEIYVADFQGGVYRVQAPAPSCDVLMNNRSYAVGQTITVNGVAIANRGAFERPVELKIYLRAPGADPLAALNIGATGSLVLSPDFEVTLGPLPLFTVSATSTKGNYEFGCRVLEPSTGEVLDAASVPFRIE